MRALVAVVRNIECSGVSKKGLDKICARVSPIVYRGEERRVKEATNK